MATTTKYGEPRWCSFCDSEYAVSELDMEPICRSCQKQFNNQKSKKRSQR